MQVTASDEVMSYGKSALPEGFSIEKVIVWVIFGYQDEIWAFDPHTTPPSKITSRSDSGRLSFAKGMNKLCTQPQNCHLMLTRAQWLLYSITLGQGSKNLDKVDTVYKCIETL